MDHLGAVVDSGALAISISWPVFVDPLVVDHPVVASFYSLTSRPLVGVDPWLAGIVNVMGRLATEVVTSLWSSGVVQDMLSVLPRDSSA